MVHKHIITSVLLISPFGYYEEVPTFMVVYFLCKGYSFPALYKDDSSFSNLERVRGLK